MTKRLGLISPEAETQFAFVVAGDLPAAVERNEAVERLAHTLETRLGEAQRAIRIASTINQLSLGTQNAPERFRPVGRGKAFAERREVDAFHELAVRRFGIAGALQCRREV